MECQRANGQRILGIGSLDCSVSDYPRYDARGEPFERWPFKELLLDAKSLHVFKEINIQNEVILDEAGEI